MGHTHVEEIPRGDATSRWRCHTVFALAPHSIAEPPGVDYLRRDQAARIRRNLDRRDAWRRLRDRVGVTALHCIALPSTPCDRKVVQRWWVVTDGVTIGGIFERKTIWKKKTLL